jgi:acetylornithine/N-succinyldiaminopimelate aminotransferase
VNVESNSGRSISAHYISGEPDNETVASLMITSAEGPFLIDQDGTKYLDWSSCLNAPFGHSYRLDTTDIPVNVGNYFSTQRLELLSRLVRLFPYLDGFQFRSSGTESVEATLRYIWAALTTPPQLVTVEGAYHGLTLGSRILTGTSRDYGSATILPFPFQSGLADAVDMLRRMLATSPVALFLEPIQGATLRKLPNPFVDALLVLKSRYGDQLVIVYDDMLASIRCGNWCSIGPIETMELRPDAVIAGKSWSNGFPFSFFGVSSWIRQTAGEILGTTSFGGNPLACAHVVDTIDRIKRDGILPRIASIDAAYGDEFRSALGRHEHVRRVEWHGMLFGLEMSSLSEARSVAARAIATGLLVSVPAASAVIRCSPPLDIGANLLEKGIRILSESVMQDEP